MNTRHPYWPDYTDDEGDALQEWFDDTCGDCLTGRCHWGGVKSRESKQAADEGREYEHPTFGRCGCARHGTSVVARRYFTGDAKEYALAWRDAKRSGEVVVNHD